jgi:hypothetical protein
VVIEKGNVATPKMHVGLYKNGVLISFVGVHLVFMQSLLVWIEPTALSCLPTATHFCTQYIYPSQLLFCFELILLYTIKSDLVE